MSAREVRSGASPDPFGAPLEYVGNDRGVWAICKKTLPGPRRQLIHNGRKPR